MSFLGTLPARLMIDDLFVDAVKSGGMVDYLYAAEESRRSPVQGDGSVVVSFDVTPDTGDVIAHYFLQTILPPEHRPTTGDQMSQLFAIGYGRKDDKRVMITLGGSGDEFANASTTELLVPWTDWNAVESTRPDFNKFVVEDHRKQPVWLPVVGVLDVGMKFHITISGELAAKARFVLGCYILMSEELRQATARRKHWKIGRFASPAHEAGHPLHREVEERRGKKSGSGVARIFDPPDGRLVLHTVKLCYDPHSPTHSKLRFLDTRCCA